MVLEKAEGRCFFLEVLLEKTQDAQITVFSASS